MRFRSFNFLRWFSFIWCCAEMKIRMKILATNEHTYRYEPSLHMIFEFYSVMHGASSVALIVERVVTEQRAPFGILATILFLFGSKFGWFVWQRAILGTPANRKRLERWCDEFAIRVSGKKSCIRSACIRAEQKTESDLLSADHLLLPSSSHEPTTTHIRSTFCWCQLRHRYINLPFLAFYHFVWFVLKSFS